MSPIDLDIFVALHLIVSFRIMESILRWCARTSIMVLLYFLRGHWRCSWIFRQVVSLRPVGILFQLFSHVWWWLEACLYLDWSFCVEIAYIHFFSSFLCLYPSLVINLGIAGYSSVQKDLRAATCFVLQTILGSGIILMSRTIWYHDWFWFHGLFSITTCSGVTTSCVSRTMLVLLSILVSQTMLVSQTLWCFCKLCGFANFVAPSISSRLVGTFWFH